MTNTELSQGQNRDISGSAIDVLLLWPESLGVLDATAFILGADGKTKVDNDMVFFNQPYGAGGAVELKNSRTGSTTFTVLADRLPPSVQRIVFCLTVDEKTPSGTTIKNFDGLSIVAKTSDSASFRPDLSKATEMAMMVAEIYRRGDGFKIRAIGQGFNGGLGPLARSFGVSLEDEAPVPAPPAVPPPASVPSSISLKKVTLEKLGKVSLDKRSGAIKAVLSWEGRGGGGDGDLEFYCYYVDKSGKCGTIYWNNLGSPSQHPFIAHSGDSQVAGSETIVIHEPEELKFALFAAYSALGNGAGAIELMPARNF